jgi:hypothetical protein
MDNCFVKFGLWLSSGLATGKRKEPFPGFRWRAVTGLSAFASAFALDLK